MLPSAYLFLAVVCEHMRARVQPVRARPVPALLARHTKRALALHANINEHEKEHVLTLSVLFRPTPGQPTFDTRNPWTCSSLPTRSTYRCQHQMPSAPNTSRARTATIGPRPEGCGQGACTGHPSKQASGNSTANGTRGAVTTSNRAAARNGAS